MASNYKGYFKIIQPLPHTGNSDQAQEVQQASNALATINWFSQVIRGSGSRIQRYRQYDNMDSDIDVSRALDIIAEEISNDDPKTNLPFVIEYQNENGEEVSEAVVITIRAALRNWARIQDLNNRVFRISRLLVKYGDCIFLKRDPVKKWDYVKLGSLTGIEVGPNNERINYMFKDAKANKLYMTSTANDTSTIPVKASSVVHFTLSDDMEDIAFGESVLAPIYKTFMQLGAIEDSVIIYRIVRAPERRVFYIDTGNTPPQRHKRYLEEVRNEVRQKRMPNSSGTGGDMVDGAYNVQSISEDYFFAQSPGGRGSRVEVLPGGENLGEMNELKYFRNKLFQGLRIPSSYMSNAEGQPGAWNDGKVGVAYIEELRFANYIRRLQNKVETVFDAEFKQYLTAIGINVDNFLFQLRLPEPQNFSLYRQAALDADLINSYKSVEDVAILSARFKLKRYLGLTEEEIQVNELMLKQELGIDDEANLSDIRQIYDAKQMEARRAVKVKPKIEEKTQDAPEGGDEGGDMGMGGDVPEEDPSLSGGDMGMPDFGQ